MLIENISSLTQAAEIKKIIKQDKNVAGMWSKLDSDKNGNFFYRLVFQNEDENKAVQIIVPREGGKKIISEGTITFGRRKNVGIPTRITYFTPTKGNKIILNETEF